MEAERSMENILSSGAFMTQKKYVLDTLIDETVLAIFSQKDLAETLVLKGGTGLRFFQGMNNRGSTDIDFSHGGQIENQDEYFKKLEGALKSHFLKMDLLAFDLKATRKPKQVGANDPPGWGGWLIEFKFGDRESEQLPIEARRRSAIVPEGSNTSKMEVEISEHEYVGDATSKSIRGVKVRGYSLAMFMGEKIRAICQQSTKYRVEKEKKNRAKDFFDIFHLSQQMSSSDREELKKILPAIFEAKGVTFELLNEFWNESFIGLQKRGFQAVQNQVRTKVEPFETYVENIRFLLIQDLGFKSEKTGK